MLKEEIVNQSNSYKKELNECTRKAENCHQAMHAFGLLENYYKSKTKQVRLYKNICVFAGVFSTAFAIALIPFALPIALSLCGFSIFAWNRTAFFSDVIKKFDYCHTYFNHVVKYLSDKKETYKTKCDEVLTEITKLETMMPENVIEELKPYKSKEILNNEIFNDETVSL